MSDMRPKALADLEYTSRDIAYLERHWREEGYDTAPNEHHVAEFNISYNRVVAALEGAKSFLVAGSDGEEFDGGALNFSFSGHGREGDGTLCLNDDTYFSADDFVDSCLEIQRAAPGLSKLRIALLLDSCYSGEFLLRVLERVLRDHLDALTPEYFLASAMPDEVSWEVGALRHGLSTFCFSVRPHRPDSMTATADGFETTWAIAEGAKGCSLISGGAQNPIITYEGYELEGGFGVVKLWDGEPYNSRLRTRAEWVADLLASRDELRAALGKIHVQATRQRRGKLTDSSIAKDVERFRELRLGSSEQGQRKNAPS